MWWTTVNVAEAIPGVPTPLGWTFWTDAMEHAAQWSFCDMGVFPAATVKPRPSMEDRFAAIFYGRVAVNLDLLCRVAASMPGTSPAALEEQFFGTTRAGLEFQASRRRYPAIAAKLPVNVALLQRRLARLRAESEQFWRASMSRPLDGEAARPLLTEARLQFKQVVRRHGFATMMAQALYEQVCRMAAAAGRPGLETRLVTGYGGLEEWVLAADLWEVARGRRRLPDFLDRHGYHGPDEGELSSRTWREDPEPLRVLLDAYRQMGDDASPEAMQRRQIAERESAERELLGSLGVVGRARARLVLTMARRYIPLREVGKAAFLQVLDVVRASSRAIGAGLAAARALGDPEDVFYLTVDEVMGARPSDAGEPVAFRRSRREHYLTLEIPELFQGQPTAVPIEDGAAAEVGETIEGVPVSPGGAEGSARVVLDPSEGHPLVPGEVLVARTTDPSWVSMFLAAGGLVIDIGGALSHGAIVARELGIPCVIGTKIGTRRLRTGDRVRVDGRSGVVEVLARSGE